MLAPVPPFTIAMVFPVHVLFVIVIPDKVPPFVTLAFISLIAFTKLALVVVVRFGRTPTLELTTPISVLRLEKFPSTS